MQMLLSVSRRGAGRNCHGAFWIDVNGTLLMKCEVRVDELMVYLEMMEEGKGKGGVEVKTKEAGCNRATRKR